MAYMTKAQSLLILSK